MRKAITFGIVVVMVLMGFVALANPIAAVPSGTIEKSMNDTSLWLGDYVWITLDVTITEGTLKIVDDLPEYLSYLKGTFCVNGVLVKPKMDDDGIYIKRGPGDWDIMFRVVFDSAPAETFWDENTAYLMDGERIVAQDTVEDIEVKLFCNFHKYATNMRDEDGDGIIEVGENIIWDFMISIYDGYGWTMKGVKIWDRFGAEIEVDVDPSVNYGTWDIKTKGRSEKIFLTWDVGDLNPTEHGILTMVISTDLNPAGHQEYTSPGIYEMNSGAVLKFKNPYGIQLSAHTPSIMVEVI